MRILFMLLALLLPGVLVADIPIIKEQLLSEQDQVRMKLGLTYSNIELSSSQQEDDLVGALNGRYGWTKDLELNGTIAHQANSVRTDNNEASSERHRQGFKRANLGMTWQVNASNLRNFVFLEGTVLEEVSYPDNSQKQFAIPPDQYELVQGKTWVFGGMVMAVEEPVIYGLQASFTKNLPYNIGPNRIENGNGFGLLATSNFLLNPENSIEWGIQWDYTSPAFANGQQKNAGAVATSWLMAVEFSVVEDTFGNLSISQNINGANSLTVSSSITLDF